MKLDKHLEEREREREEKKPKSVDNKNAYEISPGQKSGQKIPQKAFIPKFFFFQLYFLQSTRVLHVLF